jgi:hypothetical protein
MTNEMKLYILLNFLNTSTKNTIDGYYYAFRSWIDWFRYKLYFLKSKEFSGGIKGELMRNESINVLLQQISLKNPDKLYSTTLSKTRDRMMSMMYNEGYAVQMYSGYIYTELLWMGHKLRIIYWGIPSVDNLRYGYTTQSGTNTYYLGIWSESSTIIENFLAVPQLSVDTDRFYISRSGDLITKDWNSIKSIDNIYHQDIPHLKSLLDNFRNDTGMYSSNKTPQRLHILLSGTPGCGKTQTAYSVAKYLKLPLYTDTNLGNLLNYVGKMNAVCCSTKWIQL